MAAQLHLARQTNLAEGARQPLPRTDGYVAPMPLQTYLLPQAQGRPRQSAVVLPQTRHKRNMADAEAVRQQRQKQLEDKRRRLDALRKRKKVGPFVVQEREQSQFEFQDHTLTFAHSHPARNPAHASCEAGGTSGLIIRGSTALRCL